MTEQAAAVTPGSTPPRARWLLAAAALLVGVVLGLWLTGRDAAPRGDLEGSTGAVASDALDRQVATLQERVEASPDDAAAWLLLGQSHVLVAEQDGDASAWARAEEALDTAERLAPDDPNVDVARGALALSQHRFADALARGRVALAELPSSPAALGVVVDAQVELGRYDAAAETLQQLLDARPDLRALARASYLRELGGDLDGAIVAMQQAVTAGTGQGFDAGTIASLLGDLLLRAGDVDAAASAYAGALEAAAGDLPQAEVGLARVAVARGDVAAATARLAALVETAPRLDALLLLGDLARLAGDDAAAERADELVRATSALAQQGGQVVDLELALFEADHGSAQRAVDLAGAAYEARRTIFTAVTLATALAGVGEAERAAPLADEAVRLGTPHAELLVRAALVAGEADLPDVAAVRLAAALDLAPWFAVGLADDAASLARRLADDVADGVVTSVDADDLVLPPAWAVLDG